MVIRNDKIQTVEVGGQASHSGVPQGPIPSIISYKFTNHLVTIPGLSAFNMSQKLSRLIIVQVMTY